MDLNAKTLILELTFLRKELIMHNKSPCSNCNNEAFILLWASFLDKIASMYGNKENGHPAGNGKEDPEAAGQHGTHVS
jgi:hypothetical protein